MGWFGAVGTVVLAVVASFGLLATFQALGYVTDTIPYSFVGPDHPPDYLGKVNMMVWSSATFMVVCGIFAAMIWIGRKLPLEAPPADNHMSIHAKIAIYALVGITVLALARLAEAWLLLTELKTTMP